MFCATLPRRWRWTRAFRCTFVAARLGDDPKTLLSTYAHLLESADGAAANALASALVDKSLTETAV
jgi:hypothetical protein